MAPWLVGSGEAGYPYRGWGQLLDGYVEDGHRATQALPPLTEPHSTMDLGSPVGIFWLRGPQPVHNAGSWWVCSHRIVESLVLEKASSPTMNEHHIHQQTVFPGATSNSSREW